ncbi:hypothetical protein [Psychrobacter phenylpyruvicus]|uniref:Uncharacterized protein n=1 Tax=Psychrobacter phenylpyruvicus TaxID=29432 RepID=A0A379LR12_9GAMM|nr:hypothetical protein [Psychrobacter phenylpyruvicus]SUD92277.1 Uncharacterised protein [Psychrobacter phenylpyruvicus]
MVATGQATKERNKITYTKIDEDVIRNIGYTSIENNSDKKMVLLGDKYSYVLSRGIEDVDLMTKLDPKYLQMPKVVYVDRSTEDYISTDLDFDYVRPDEKYTDQEKSILKNICNETKTNSWKPKTYYHCSSTLKGNLYKTRTSDKRNYSLNQGRKVEIRQMGSTTYREYGDLSILPLTLAVDAVTLPLQLLWLGSSWIIYNNNQSQQN